MKGETIRNVDIADVDFLGNEINIATASKFKFNRISVESYLSEITMATHPP